MVKALTTQIEKAKPSFVTRNVNLKDARHAIYNHTPTTGDLCLARVDKIGLHQRLELPTGRRSRLFIGDELILAYGDRYATGQFESKVPLSLEQSSLVASGGIISGLLSRHSSSKQPTKVTPLCILAKDEFTPINLVNYKNPRLDYNSFTLKSLHTSLIVGSGMNAGKTTTLSYYIRAIKKAGLSVAALKITGTGSGGDLWYYKDAGADIAMDFTDVGYSTTANFEINTLMEITHSLYNYASASANVVLIELADGILQSETKKIIANPEFQKLIDATIFATGDSMAAISGINILEELNYNVKAISGAVTASHLARVEVEKSTGIKTIGINDFENDDEILTNIFSTNTHTEKFTANA